MSEILSLCPATWSKIVAFLSRDGIKQRHGAAWYQLAELAVSMVRTFELEILMARTLKLGAWPLRRREEFLTEGVRLPNYFWIKYRMLGPRQYRRRGIPPPAEMTTGRNSYEWAPWLEQKCLEFILETMDNAEDWRDNPQLRGTLDW